jgi:hypothetical protein
VRQAECKFEGDAAQVRAARRFITGFLGGDWPDSDAAVLLASDSLNLTICLSCLFWLV